MNQTISKLLYNARQEQKKLTNIYEILENFEENNNMNKTIDFRNISNNTNDEETIVFNEMSPQINYNTNGELVESTIEELFLHQTAKGGAETEAINAGVEVTNIKIVKPSKELVIAKLKQKDIKHDPETIQKTIDKVETKLNNENFDDFTTKVEFYINSLNNDIIKKDQEIWENLDNAKDEENIRKWEQQISDWMNEQNKDILETEGELLKYDIKKETDELSEEIAVMGGKKTRRRKTKKRKTKRKKSKK